MRPNIKLKGQWVYLYRAVDKQGRTVDFLLSKRPDVATAGVELAEKIKKNQFNLRLLTEKIVTAGELWSAVLAA